MKKPDILIRIENYKTSLQILGVPENHWQPFRISWKEMFFIYKYFNDQDMVIKLCEDQSEDSVMAYYHGIEMEIID